jgi:hypothetical protein
MRKKSKTTTLTATKMTEKIQTLAKDLGIPPLKFERDKGLKAYRRGKELTIGEMKAIASQAWAAGQRPVVWLEVFENGEDQGKGANYVEEGGGESFMFDNGSSFGTDFDLERRKDDELAEEWCSGWLKKVYQAVPK